MKNQDKNGIGKHINFHRLLKKLKKLLDIKIYGLVNEVLVIFILCKIKIMC